MVGEEGGQGGRGVVRDVYVHAALSEERMEHGTMRA